MTPIYDLLYAAQQINAGVYSAFGPMMLSASAQTNNLTLSWPFLPGDFVLQWTTNLSSSSTWQTVNGQTNQVGTQNVLSLPLGSNSGFFRLAEP